MSDVDISDTLYNATKQVLEASTTDDFFTTEEQADIERAQVLIEERLRAKERDFE